MPGLLDSRVCLFFKIYGSERYEEEYLRTRVRPLINQMIGDGGLNAFFFIRYGDPRRHLRLRFFGERRFMGRELRALLYSSLNGWRPNRGRAVVVKTAVYRREYDRYGGARGVRIAEELFFHDSRLALNFLAAGKGAISKATFVVATAEAMLAAFGMTVSPRDRLFAQGLSRAARTQRLESTELTACERGLAGALDRARRDPFRFLNLLGPGLAATSADFVDRVRSVGALLHRHREEITRPLPVLAHSYVHMHFNRFGLGPGQEILLRLLRARRASQSR